MSHIVELTSVQLRDISLGLVHLHSLHIVHADLKAVSSLMRQVLYVLFIENHVCNLAQRAD